MNIPPQDYRKRKNSNYSFDYEGHHPYDSNTPYTSTRPERFIYRSTKGRFKSRRKLAQGKPQGRAVKNAQNQLKRFKQGSILAVALTSFLLVLFTPEESGFSQNQMQQENLDSSHQTSGDNNESTPDSISIIEKVAVEDLFATESMTREDTIAVQGARGIGKAAKDEALITLQNLWDGFYSNLPKMLVAIAILIIAWLIIRLFKMIFRKSVKTQRSGAAFTLLVITIWLFAIGLAISVVAGDIRALVGSIGLIGLALSWSLQTPIESFTGWLLNSFRGYYRVGDRIMVGDVFGDVYKIDFLTTTVWEIGAPYKPGFVRAEQPTGRLVTFPNNEILTGTVVNLTGDFPYVWDELAVAIGNESDIRGSMEVIGKIAADLLGDYMEEPAHQYYKTLKKAHLNYTVSDKPLIFISLEESWTDIIVRYLVGARERRKWKTELTLRIIEEINKPEHKDKIKPVYPRQQVQIIRPDGIAEDPRNLKPAQ